ncbi:MAG: DUF4157 domain-containing protein, partial [Microscillaceae bacterium]|nr:DUF4157 domain-containing protein [Microscillaceae bacterium]
AFGSGEYRPGTLVGDALLAHELAHVEQQKGASLQAQTKLEMGGAEYNTLEQEADKTALHTILSIYKANKTTKDSKRRTSLSLQRCGKDEEKEVGYEKDVKVIPPPKTSNAETATMKVTIENATEIGKRLIAGKPGLDPNFTGKNGGSSFFVSKGNPYIGITGNQTVGIEVSVKIPVGILEFTDGNLLDIQTKIMEKAVREAIAREGGSVPKNFDLYSNRSGFPRF